MTLPIREIENAWIPLADGTRLAARLWLPETDAPVPAILDLIPYRKRDHYRLRDGPIYAWLAAQGYGCARVDARGTGESDGVILGEFLPQEQDDGCEVVAWLAAQTWCSGRVAMQGLSWGGFSALQVAARRPPALGAVVAVGAGDDRYDASLHYTGGCLLNEQLWVAAYYALVALRPPDPAIVGDRWRAMWRERLDAHEPWIGDWLAHPHRDAFWDQGSVGEDYGAIGCPVFAAGGWADYLSKCVPSLLSGLTVPRRGVIGPWGHMMPQTGEPGEPIGFLQEVVGWYDRWLKDRENGVEREPMLRAWLGPEGPWIAEAVWPSTRIEWRVVALGGERPRRHRSAQTIGLAAPEWSRRAGVPGQEPGDQRADDGQSLVYDLAAEGPFDLLGAARLTLDLAVDRPVAYLVARLNDVAPDGTSTRVALRALNLTHRNGSRHPVAMVPGRRTRVTLAFPDQAWRLRPGHRLRVALSNTYWPVIWPAPEPVEMVVHGGSIELPVRPPDAADLEPPPFGPPVQAAPVAVTTLRPARIERSVRRDVVTGETSYELRAEGGFYGPEAAYRIEETGTEVEHALNARSSVQRDDPLSARSELAQSYGLRRGAWRTRLDLTLTMTADRENFHVTVSAAAFEDETAVFDRAWALTRPRKLV